MIGEMLRKKIKYKYKNKKISSKTKKQTFLNIRKTTVIKYQKDDTLFKEL